MGGQRLTNYDIRICLMEDQWFHYDSKLAMDEQDPEMLFDSINNAFIERLALSFAIGTFVISTINGKKPTISSARSEPSA